MSIERSTKTVSEVIRRVFRTFGDESGTQITSSDVIDWIDQAQREIVTQNREVNSVFAIIPSVANQAEYDLSTLPDVLRIQSIHYNNKYIENISFQRAQEIMADNLDVTGDPTMWYEYGGVIHFFPVPSDDIDNGIKIFYNKAPTPVTSEGDVLTVPDNYFNGVVDYCLKHAYELDENAAMAKSKLEDFGRSITSNAVDTLSSSNTNPTIRDVYGDW